MAITLADFNKIWASSSPLTPYSFSDDNYNEGWNFIVGTPPSRQMWDFLQKNNDEKSQFLLNNFNNYLPLSGGTMTGAIEGNPLTLTADDGNGNSADLVLNADGSATLDGNNVITSAGGTFTGTVNGVTPTAGDDTTKLATTAYVQEEIRQHGNLPIGYEYFTFNPSIPQGSLPLFGGEYDRATYSDLWAWVQTQTGYLITDSAWQALSNTQNGNVPFYSSGDGSTTFRVPSLKCWIKGTDGTETVGTYLDAGLPNIEGTVAGGFYDSSYVAAENSGAFSNTVFEQSNALYGNGGSIFNFRVNTFNASLHNQIYGNSTTVQPESIVGMWLVKCYGTVADTGTINEKAYMDEQLALNVPVGCVQAYAGQTTPQGWLLCDGSAVSRTQYSRLFGVIGTTYGAGDGTDTFNVPNLVDKFIQGNATSGTEHSAGLPNITSKSTDYKGVCCWSGNSTPKQIGAIERTLTDYRPSSGSMGTFQYIDFDASRSSAVYGNSTTVQPPALTMQYVIKY